MNENGAKKLHSEATIEPLNKERALARTKSTVVLNLYSINARQRDELLAYGDFFAQLAALDSSATIRSISSDLSFAIDLEELVASPEAERRDKRNSKDEGEGDRGDGDGVVTRTFVGRIIAGSPGEVPLYFDYETGQTEEGATPEGKWLAQVSRLVVSLAPTARYLVLESRRSGVTVSRLTRYFSQLAEQVTASDVVEFDIIPVQSDSLREEIEGFERIRQASAIVSRPNFDWDDMSGQLSDLIDESGGHEGEATVRAARGDSLSKTSGIVGTILASIDSGIGAIRKFKIAGTKPNSDRETLVTSEKHQQRAFARIDLSLPPAEVDNTLFESGVDLISNEINTRAAVQIAAASHQGDDTGG